MGIRFKETKEDKYKTPGFVLPPSGTTRGWKGKLSWQYSGLELEGSYSQARRPCDTYGVDRLKIIPNEGIIEKWGGSLGYGYHFQGNW